MRHPEPGEAKAAAEVLRLRLEASMPEGDEVQVGEVNIKTGEMRGEMGAMRSSYGDLFDIAELAEVSQAPVINFLTDIALAGNPEASMRSMYLLAAAHGVLMERARWEK